MKLVVSPCRILSVYENAEAYTSQISKIKAFCKISQNAPFQMLRRVLTTHLGYTSEMYYTDKKSFQKNLDHQLTCCYAQVFWVFGILDFPNFFSVCKFTGYLCDITVVIPYIIVSNSPNFGVLSQHHTKHLVRPSSFNLIFLSHFNPLMPGGNKKVTHT